MAKDILFEVPPPGAGLNTITVANPGVDTSAAAIGTCSCVPFTYVVVRLVPLQYTTDPLTNPVPFTVRVKAAVPAMTDEGDSELINGAGLDTVDALIVKSELPEIPKPGAGLDTVTGTVPVVAISAALMDAWSCPSPTYTVVRLVPFQFTTDPLTNPLPFTVRVKALVPAVADEGDNDVIEGP